MLQPSLGMEGEQLLRNSSEIFNKYFHASIAKEGMQSDNLQL